MRLYFYFSSILLLSLFPLQCFSSSLGEPGAIEIANSDDLNTQGSSVLRCHSLSKHSKHSRYPKNPHSQTKNYEKYYIHSESSKVNEDSTTCKDWDTACKLPASITYTSEKDNKSNSHKKRSLTRKSEWRFISKSELPPKISRIVEKIEQDWKAHVESQRGKKANPKPFIAVIESHNEASSSISSDI